MYICWWNLTCVCSNSKIEHDVDYRFYSFFIDFHSPVVVGMNHHYYCYHYCCDVDGSEFDSCVTRMIVDVVILVLLMLMAADEMNHCSRHGGRYRRRHHPLHHSLYLWKDRPSLLQKFPKLRPIFLVVIDNGVVDDRNEKRIRHDKMGYSTSSDSVVHSLRRSDLVHDNRVPSSLE